MDFRNLIVGKVIRKWKPWESAEQYQKTCEYLGHLFGYYREIIPRSVDYVHGTHPISEAQIYQIAKTFRLPDFPHQHEEAKDWKQFLEEYQKQASLQYQQSLKIIYKEKYDFAKCDRKFRIKILERFLSILVLCIVAVGMIYWTFMD